MHEKVHLEYKDVGLEVAAELQQAAQAAMHCGVPLWHIMLDPGIGFSKDLPGNLQLLANLDTCQRRMSGGFYTQLMQQRRIVDMISSLLAAMLPTW
jgi:2-amino-4-hydroxy-6-hydroxymethyldihydropteridine diphosphokinase / dihydropteroate synthase